MLFINNDYLSNLIEKNRGIRLFIYLLVDDTSKHWTNSNVIGIYFRDFNSDHEYYLNFSHYDAVKNEHLPDFKIAKLNDVVYNSKKISIGIDAEMLYWVWMNKTIDKLSYNIYTPLYKILEHCRNVFTLIKDLEINANSSTTAKYNSLLRNLSKIEENGLYTDSGYEYTEYNPFTLTGRPSNKFNNINYAALSNTDGSRKRFVSRFEDGWLAEFDFHAYHVHLIAKMMYFIFDNPNDVYGDLSILMNLPKEATKKEVFRQIYGGVKTEYKHIDFFKGLDDLFRKISHNFDKSYFSILFNKPMPLVENHIKAANYLIQNLETEVNLCILQDLNSYLDSKKSKLILYTYDSFLIDYCPEDTPNIFYQIKSILEKSGIPTRFKIGMNYNNIISKTL